MGQCLALLEDDEAPQKQPARKQQPAPAQQPTLKRRQRALQLKAQQQPPLPQLAQQGRAQALAQPPPPPLDGRVYLDVKNGNPHPSPLVQRAERVLFTPNVLAAAARRAGSSHLSQLPRAPEAAPAQLPPPPPRSPLSYVHSH